MPVKLHVKTGDTVVVISGDDKGKMGKVIKAFPRERKVIVEGVNLVTKHQRVPVRTPSGQLQAGRIQMPAPIDASNVMLVCPHCNKPTKIKRKRPPEVERPVRICKRCGEVVDQEVRK